MQHVYRGQHFMFRGDDFEPNVLLAALEKLINSTPFLAGTITSASTPGWLQVSAPYVSARELLAVVDKRGKLDYEASRARGFPPCDFPEFAGFDPMPFISPPPVPVLRAQINILRGGVVFSIFLHHATFDGPGCAVVMRAWAEACRNTSPNARVPRLDVGRGSFSLDKARGSGHLEDHLEFARVEALPSSPTPKNPVASGMWYFPEARLKQLKADASVGLPDDEWISTHDALCALLWTRVASARVQLGEWADNTTGLYNTVDSRMRIIPPVSEGFTGNSTTVVGAYCPADKLDSLSHAAQLVHASIKEGATDDRVRDVLAMFAHFKDDMRRVGLNWERIFTCGFVVSSWARLDSYELDWGNAFCGQRCDRIRHPWDFAPGVAAPMPAGAYGVGDKGLEVLVALSPAQIQLFDKDEVLRKYAQRVY